MQNKTDQAIRDISEVFKFDLWLRFYFIQDKDGRLSLELDDQVLEKMAKEYGHLAELASVLNRQELNPAVCQKAIVEHLMDKYDGNKYAIGYIPKLLDSAGFKSEIQLFNAWVHLHENQLDKNTLGFGKWVELYEEWRQSEHASQIELSFSMQNARQDSPAQSKKTN